MDGAVRWETTGLFPGVGRSSCGLSVSVMDRFWGWVSVVSVVDGETDLARGFCRENTDCLSSGLGLKTLPVPISVALGVSAVGGLKTGWVDRMGVGFWNIGGGFDETEEESVGGSG